MKRSMVQVAGTQVAVYERAGEGRGTVLFLHGVGGTGKMWAAQMRHLRRFGRMLAIDLPGFAGGALPHGVQDLSDFPAFVCAVLDALDVPSAVWVGNSMGGRIALEVALQSPRHVQGLGLVCAAGIRIPQAQVVPPNSRPKEEFDKLVFYQPERFLAKQSPASVEATQRARALYEELAANTSVMDFEGRLCEIQVPALCIWGRHDGVVPLGIGEAFARGIAGAQLIVLEESAHVPHVEQPEAVSVALETLLERVYGAYEGPASSF